MARVPTRQGDVGRLPFEPPSAGEDQQNLAVVGHAAAEAIDKTTLALRRVDHEHAELWVAEQMGRARTDWSRRLNDLRMNAPDDPTGIAQRVSADFDAYRAELAAAAPSGIARGELERRLAGTFKPWLDEQAEAFETDRMIRRTERRVGDLIGAHANAALRNPALLKASLDDVNRALDATTLPADRREEWRKRAANALATQALKGVVETDPARAVEIIKAGVYDGVKLDDVLRVNPETGSSNAATLLDQAQGELRRRDALARQERIEQRREATATLVTMTPHDLASREQTGKGIDISDDLMTQAGWPKARIKEYRERQRAASDLFTARTDAAMWTPQQVNDYAASAADGGPDAKYEGKRRSAIETVLRERQQAIAAGDAPAWVLQHSPAVRRAYEEVRIEGLSPEGRDVRLDRALRATADAQTEIGIPANRIGLIGKSRAMQFVAGLDPAKPMEMSAKLDATLQSYPEWARPIVLRELKNAGLPDLAVSLGEIPHPQARRALSEVSALGIEKLKATVNSGTPNGVGETFNALQPALTPWRNAFAASGALAEYERVFRDIEKLALAEVAGGRTPAAAAQRAVEMRFGHLEIVGGFMAPRGQGRKIEEGARKYAPLLIDRVSWPSTGDERIDGSAAHRKEIEIELKSRVQLVNANDGRGLFLRWSTGQWVQDRATGARIYIPFEIGDQPFVTAPRNRRLTPQSYLRAVEGMQSDNTRLFGPRFRPEDAQPDAVRRPPPAQPGALGADVPPLSVLGGRPAYVGERRPQRDRP